MVSERLMRDGLLLHNYVRAKGIDATVEYVANQAVLGHNGVLELEGSPTIPEAHIESTTTELATLIIKLTGDF